MTLLFFYQYNDTQLSCVFKKKNNTIQNIQAQQALLFELNG